MLKVFTRGRFVTYAQDTRKSSLMSMSYIPMPSYINTCEKETTILEPSTRVDSRAIPFALFATNVFTATMNCISIAGKSTSDAVSVND
jgi:hypothetical protein